MNVLGALGRNNQISLLMLLMCFPEAGGNRPIVIQLENGAITSVDNFTYLGSNITKDGEILVQG